LKNIIKAIAKIIMKILFKVEVINKENVPNTGRAILCSNHIHAVDGPLVLAFTDRKVNFIAKKELWKNKIIAYILDMFDAISVNRQKPELQTFRKIKRVLESDELLAIFPEGTRNGLAKDLEAKDGAAFMAINNNAPIIPIKLIGNYRIFSKVKMIYGKPLVLANKDVKEGTKQIMQAIQEIEEPSFGHLLVKKIKH
jgi:1-acyl-sn-glycerol-3-phosphate acyltransferase